MNDYNIDDSSELVFLKNRVAELEAKETRLQADYQHLRQLYEQAPLAYQSLDIDGCFIEVNQAWLETLGYTREEIIGRNFGDFLHPDWRDHFKENFPRFKAIGEILGIEFEIVKKDGSPILVSFHGKIGKDPEGSFQQTHCIFHDITERKKADDALRLRESYLSAIIENHPGLLWLKDRDNRFLSVNTEFSKSCGLNDPELLVGKTDADIWPKELADKYLADDIAVLKSGKPLMVEEPISDKGELKWFETIKTPIFDNQGRTIGTTGYSRDITERKQTEEALRESEARFRALHNASFGGIVIHDQGIILDCNQGLSDQTGYPPEELIGKDGLLLVAPEYRNLVMQNIQRGFEQTYEIEGLRKDNTRYPVSIRGTNIPYKGRTVRVAEFRDITEYKRMEEALEKRLVTLTCPLTRANGITFEDLFDPLTIQRIQDEFAAATGVASIITLPDGTPITTPSNFTHLCSEIIRKTEHGCSNCFKSDAVIGRYHPSGPIVQTCLSGGLWDAGASITVGGHHIANWLIGQVRNETQNEESMLAYARAIGADPAGFIKAFKEVPSMSRDRFEHIAQALFTLANQLSGAAYQNIQQARSITERKQVEKALRESEERFRMAMDATKDGLWDWDIETGKVYYSPSFWSMLGYDADTRSQSTEAWIEMIHPDDQQAVVSAKNDCIENRFETLLIEYRMRTNDGNWKWIQGRGKAVVRDNTGLAQRMVGTHIDITERKQAEDEREKLKAQLQQSQKLESIARLAGGIAHDFNNMLTVIQGHADLAIMNMPPDDPYFHRFSAIRDTVQRSAELTRQLLAFARKQPIAPKLLDLNEIVERMLTMLRRLIGEDINLAWMPGKGLWSVKADPSQIDQILANLCVNARDAIAGVGKIIVETGNSTFDDEYCSSHEGFVPGDYVRISLSDDGCGMDKQMIARIFEPFFTTKGVGKGTGLGLATVYGAVKQNDGFVNVYSEPGQGSVFTIFLPRHEGEAAQTWIKDTARSAVRGHETILLVEDEPTILEMTTTILQQLGYTVLAASSPSEAIAVVKAHDKKIDLLLTDVIMPEMNGRDLADRLCINQPWIKRLFMSGYTADIIAHQGVLDEGVQFIQKPFSHTALAAKVRMVLGRGEEGIES